MKRCIALIVLITFCICGCMANMGSKQGTGTILGAGTGALLGAQVGGGRGRLIAVAIGTLAGALMGQEIGRSLDRADQAAMERTAHEALESNQSNKTSTWRNPDSGNAGTITPVKTYQTPEGRYCREYTQTVVIAGEEQQAYGTACRQPDGSWLTVK